jgi:twitching motility protein PilT
MSRSLGTILLEQGVVDRHGLEQAESLRKETGATLGKALLDLGLADEADLMRALATEVGMEFVDVAAGAIDPHAAEMLPRSLAEQLEAVPVAFGEGDELVVAITNPSNAAVRGQIEAATGLSVRLVLATRSDIRAAIMHLPSVHTSQELDLSRDVAVAAEGSGNGRTVASPRRDTAMREVESEEPAKTNLDDLLQEMVDVGGSDLHLTAGTPPVIRVHGELERVQGHPDLDSSELRKMVYGILTQRQREEFENNLELDLSYAVPGLARFRVNVFMQRDSLGAVMRVIPYEIKPLDELGIPAQVANFAYLPRGLVLVTGPTGSGKSTTLASLIDLANQHRAVHIMTIEDPIEFLHHHKRAVINQREVGADTHGFAAALKHVLRQDPDVILIGEMRDLETIEIALTAAETGHLVFGTLHTQDAPQTVDRIIDVFPPHQQEQIRVQLAGAVRGVVCQTLLKTADGEARAVAVEVMIATSAVRNLIREGKTHQIYSAIQAGAQHGMISMDQSLATLVKKKKITYDEALQRCQNVEEFNRLVGR